MSELVPDMQMVSCGTADCENGTHSFNNREFKRTSEKHNRRHLSQGVCKSCGADLIMWERLHRRDVSDMGFTFDSLKQETIRAEFWNRELNARVQAQMSRLGEEGVLARVRPTLAGILGHEEIGHLDHLRVPIRDEKITSIVQYAQHAVASCCRVCARQWHGISEAGDLGEQDLQYLVDLTSAYIVARLRGRS
jgi:hypothetical protein